MDKEKKNRSGSQSNRNSDVDKNGERRRTSLPGAPAKGNRQTGGNRKDEPHSSEKDSANKGLNSI